MSILSFFGIDALLNKVRESTVELTIAIDDRVALAQLEWEEEKRRLLTMGALVLVGLGLTMAFLIATSFAVVVNFWDTPYRIRAAWGVSGVWFVLWCVAGFWMWRLTAHISRPFSLTREELAKDWKSLKESL